MIDIPMKTTEATGIAGLVTSSLGAPSGNYQQQTYNEQSYQQSYQQPVQQNYSQQAYNNNLYQQNNYQQPMQNSYQQPNYNQQTYQQQPVQQSYQQQPVQQSYQQQPVQQAYQQQPIQQQQPVKQRPASGSGVHLKKGQKIALTEQGQQLNTIKVCLGWDVVNRACDLDASAFMLGANGKVIGDEWFVFYGQLNSPDGSIIHSGDSQGEGDGDDEIITINANQVNQQVQKITFVVTINEALERGLNFSMVQNAYVRVVEAASNKELARFDLTDYYSTVTSMVVGELYRHNGSWKFNAVGDGVKQDLTGLCGMYGVNVAD